MWYHEVTDINAEDKFKLFSMIILIYFQKKKFFTIGIILIEDQGHFVTEKYVCNNVSKRVHQIITSLRL